MDEIQIGWSPLYFLIMDFDNGMMLCVFLSIFSMELMTALMHYSLFFHAKSHSGELLHCGLHD